MLVQSYTKYCLDRSRDSQFFENNIEFPSSAIFQDLETVARQNQTRVSLEYVSASANQFRDGSAANSANLLFFSELSCFWARRASQDTKKGSPVTLITPDNILRITGTTEKTWQKATREREGEGREVSIQNIDSRIVQIQTILLLVLIICGRNG